MRNRIEPINLSSISLLTLLHLLYPSTLWSQEGNKIIQAHFAPVAPSVDGLLDEPAWAQATPSVGFTQRFPDPGKPAAFETQSRVLYDKQALYIGVHCFDPHSDQIQANITRRDRWIDSDWFEVYLDSRHDHRSGFYFWVNPAGVMVDGTIQRRNELNSSWDGVWEAKTRIIQPGTTNIQVAQLEPFDWVDDADYTSSSLNTNIVLRWEFLPGSVGYLVYTNAQQDELERAQFQFGHNLESLFQATGQHALMLKASYFW